VVLLGKNLACYSLFSDERVKGIVRMIDGKEQWNYLSSRVLALCSILHRRKGQLLAYNVHQY
jgi:hypothetical protein